MLIKENLMENSQKDKQNEKEEAKTANTAKTKNNQYTPEEKKFADGEGTKLDNAIDSDAANPATRGD
jgi:hypothetical protein